MQAWLITAIESLIEQFFLEFAILWNQCAAQSETQLFNDDEFKQHQHQYFKNTLHSIIGFAGLEICRRVCGIAGVRKLWILD